MCAAPQAVLTGAIPGTVVRVVTCDLMGPDAIDLVFKGAEGRLQERMHFRSDEAHIAIAVEGRTWGLDGNAGDFKLQTSEQLGYGYPSNGEFKSLAVVLCFLRFLLFSPQKATKRTKKKGIGSARLEGPFGHFF